MKLSKLDNLYRLAEDQVEAASKMCGRAFQDDPVCIYNYPDPSERKEKLRYSFELLIRYGLLYGEHRYFRDPTPGSANKSAFDGLVAKPEYTHKGGCYVNNFYLNFTCRTEDAVIRYTIDGTEPTLSNGMTYTYPIHIYPHPISSSTIA